jgi:hypothetical protein
MIPIRTHNGTPDKWPQSRDARPTCTFYSRAGLAPLELVLNLFFLLVILALIINAGTIAAWNIRGSIVVRDTAWRRLSPRRIEVIPPQLRGSDRTRNEEHISPPGNWKPPATLGLAPSRSLSQHPVGEVWNRDDLSQPALRGPGITDPATGSQMMLADLEYLEMVNQLLIGTADLTKAMPLLHRLPKSRISSRFPVLDGTWCYQEMSQKTVIGAMRTNEDWRLRFWYLCERDNLASIDMVDATSRLHVADVLLQPPPHRFGVVPDLRRRYATTMDLDLLDNSGLGPGPPYSDYYPTISGCEISIENIYINLIEGPQGLVSRIQGPTAGGLGGMPERFTRGLILRLQAKIRRGIAIGDIDNLVDAPEVIRLMEQFLATLY